MREPYCAKMRSKSLFLFGVVLIFVAAVRGSKSETSSASNDSSQSSTAKVPTKESLLNAMIRYRDSLKNKVAGKQSLGVVNADTQEYSKQDEKFSASISSIVDKFAAAAKTLQKKMENCGNIKTKSTKEAKEDISQAVNQAGYEYKKELNKLYDEGLNAITEQKRKAKSVERSAESFQKSIENGYLMNKVTGNSLSQIKDAVSNEQVDLYSLKTSAKSILSNLSYFIKKLNTLETTSEITAKLQKYTDLVKNHASYIESLKDDFVKAEREQANKISGVVNKIDSRSESTFGYQQQIAKENKNDYKFKELMTKNK